MEPIQRPMLAGFWIRLAADTIDALILGVAGFLLAIPFGNLFYQLGSDGPWLGLTIAFLYAGLLQSALGNGQSLGKRLLRIQVLRLDGTCLSLPASFLRYAIVGAISYNSSIRTMLQQVVPAGHRVSFDRAFSILIGALFVACVLLIVLHPLKRGLHDLIAGSIVVYKGRYDRERLTRLSDPARETRAVLVLLLITLVALGAPFLLSRVLPKTDQQPDADIWREASVTASHPIQSVQVIQYQQVHGGRAEERRVIHVALASERARLEDKARLSSEAQEVAKAVLRVYMHPVNEVRVSFTAGFNIGIASSTTSHTERFDGTGRPLSK